MKHKTVKLKEISVVGAYADIKGEYDIRGIKHYKVFINTAFYITDKDIDKGKNQEVVR